MNSLTICFASDKTREMLTNSLLIDFILKSRNERKEIAEPKIRRTLKKEYTPVPALRRITDAERKDGLSECFMRAVVAGEFISNNRRRSHIYLICNSHTKAVKIGITNNVVSRVKSLQSSSGVELQVLATSEPPTLDVFLVERFLHDYYRHNRNIGEWLTLDQYDIKQIEILFESINAPIT